MAEGPVAFLSLGPWRNPREGRAVRVLRFQAL